MLSFRRATLVFVVVVITLVVFDRLSSGADQSIWGILITAVCTVIGLIIGTHLRDRRKRRDDPVAPAEPLS
jgi:general stress protein CsbA